MYEAEDHHWWYQGMAAITCAILDKYYPAPFQLRILDAGCGTGAAITTYLTKYGKPTGIDLFQLALDFSRKRKALQLARASVLNLPFASSSFDLITSFDVLYERAVSSDEIALCEFSRVLLPGGRILLRLPAFNWLRGQHDERVHTSRRYSEKQVTHLFQTSGFTLEHISYANMFLFPIAVLKRLSERIFPSSVAKSDLSLKTGPANKILKRILSAEAPLVANSHLPFGLSVIAIGVKK